MLFGQLDQSGGLRLGESETEGLAGEGLLPGAWEIGGQGEGGEFTVEAVQPVGPAFL